MGKASASEATEQNIMYTVAEVTMLLTMTNLKVLKVHLFKI